MSKKTEIRYLLNRWSKNFQNLPERVFLMGTKKCQKMKEIKNYYNIFQTVRFGVECPIDITIYIFLDFLKMYDKTKYWFRSLSN